MDDEREQGQAVPLMVGLVGVAVVVLWALVPLGRGAGDRARAATAADAAALAGAAEGEDAARALAEANGARLIEWRAEGPVVWVVVQLGDARAEAKARRD
jgi:outer membrane lipoprotein SlyB